VFFNAKIIKQNANKAKIFFRQVWQYLYISKSFQTDISSEQQNSTESVIHHHFPFKYSGPSPMSQQQLTTKNTTVFLEYVHQLASGKKTSFDRCHM